MQPRIVSALLAAALSACATSHYRGLSPDTMPPEIVAVTEQVPQTIDTIIRDGNGVAIGSESTIVGYRDVTTGIAFKHGDDYIDEQDFYKLAEDRDGFDAIERARRRGKVKNRVGIALMIVSSAVAISAPIALGRSTAPYAVGQWFVSFPVGLGLAFFGKKPFSQHVLSAPRAFAAIEQTPPGWANGL